MRFIGFLTAALASTWMLPACIKEKKNTSTGEQPAQEPAKQPAPDSTKPTSDLGKHSSSSLLIQPAGEIFRFKSEINS